MSEGLLTIAYGPAKYIEMAQALSLSYRRLKPDRPIAVVTDEKHRQLLQRYFDIVLPVQKNYGSGVVQKLHADIYSPFDRTLFVDSDCLFYKDPERLWKLYSHGDFSARGWRYLTGQTEYEQQNKYDMLENITSFLELNKIERLAHFNSGVFFFTKSEVSSNVFTIARSVYERRSSLGFVPFKNGPIADEPAFAVAMELCGIEMDPWDSENGMDTAINIDRILHVNVLSGEARIRKSGIERNPTLLHFNVHAQYGKLYGREMLRLKYEKKKLGSTLVPLALLPWTASHLPMRLKKRSIDSRKKVQDFAAKLLQGARRTPK